LNATQYGRQVYVPGEFSTRWTDLGCLTGDSDNLSNQRSDVRGIQELQMQRAFRRSMSSEDNKEGQIALGTLTANLFLTLTAYSTNWLKGKTRLQQVSCYAYQSWFSHQTWPRRKVLRREQTQ